MAERHPDHETLQVLVELMFGLAVGAGDEACFVHHLPVGCETFIGEDHPLNNEDGMFTPTEDGVRMTDGPCETGFWVSLSEFKADPLKALEPVILHYRENNYGEVGACRC